MKRGFHRGGSMRSPHKVRLPSYAPIYQRCNGGLKPDAARRHYEHYMARAREASLKGDSVEAENCYQHAEHYLRVMRANGARED
jgi:hypothetical protein